MTARALVLGLDTCTFWLNLALLDGRGGLVGALHERVATHATGLVPAILALLDRAGASPEGLAAVGVVTGPGSFTGLRVGLAAALGLARARGTPAYGLDSLTALALAYGREGEGIALLDARRGQVYCRRFRARAGSLESLSEPEALDPADALPAGVELAWAVGDGVPLLPVLPGSCFSAPDIPNLALPAARSALARLSAGEPGDTLHALYVRAPDAAMPPGRRAR